jgi:hypothetical protein
MRISHLSNHRPQRYFEADKGNNPPATDPQPEPTPGNDPAKTDKTFTQAELEAIVKDRLDRAQRKAKEAEEKARKDAEEKTLHEQGEFKTLAEQRAAEIADLKSQVESNKAHIGTIERLKKALEARLEADKKNLPESVQTLLNKLDVADQMEWIAANPDALKPTDKQPAPSGGTPRRGGIPPVTPPAVEAPARKWGI